MYKNLTLLFFILLGLNQHGYSQLKRLLPYTGAVQTYTVPTGVTTISLDVQGARGGHASASLGATTPSCGGRVQATLAVTGGQVLNIFVGGVGADGSATGAAGGFNGGASAAPWATTPATVSGGGGGGASDIRIGGVAFANRVIAAGGGGGAGYDSVCTPAFDQPGGSGGGLVGAAGNTCAGAWFVAGAVGITPAGGGNTTAALGGSGGNIAGSGYAAGTNGGFGPGGSNNPNGGIGGGGGGGYYGGGGGCYMGGGGGSSYADAVLASGVTHTQGYNCDSVPTGDGVVNLCAPAPGTVTGSTIVNTCSTGTVYDTTGTPGGVWSVTNTAVATTAGGVIFPVAAGVDTIYYTIAPPGCGSAYAFSVFTVNIAPKPIGGPKKMCLSSPPTLPAADTIRLTDVSPGGVWVIAPASPVATVGTFTGIVTGMSVGTVTITYGIAGGCYTTTVVTVNPAVGAISAPASLCVGDSATLTDPTPGGTWSSQYPSLAPINPITGKLHGDSASTTEITYTVSPGCFAQAFVAVNLTPLPIYAADSQVCVGSNLPLTEPIPGGAWSTSAIGTAVAFSSFPPGGQAHGVSPGTVTIFYTIPGCPAATFPLTVDALPAPITGITNICSGVPTTLHDATPGGYWLASGAPTITVGSSSGIVTGSVVGSTATVLYIVSYGAIQCFQPVTVTVDSGASPIFGPDSVCLGATTTLMDSAAGPLFGGNGIWTSSSLAVAQVVDTSGVVLGVTAGTANISYTLPTGCYSTKVFSVSPLTPAFVNVTKYPSTILCSGDSITLVANPTHSGPAPTLIWDVFSDTIANAHGDTAGYYPVHGDVVYVTMITHGVCAVHDTVIDTVPLNVYPSITVPSITINVDPTLRYDTNATLGQSYTFYSTVIFGGLIQKYQWYKNGIPITGDTSSSATIVVYQADTIACTVTGSAPCDSFNLTGISNGLVIHAPFVGVNTVPNPGNNLALFPNPNNGTFTLSGTVSTSQGGDVSLDVTDMLGRVVYSGKTTPVNGSIRQQIVLSGLSAGSYLLRVGTETGNEIFHVVVESAR